jgi:hypothetical protein
MKIHNVRFGFATNSSSAHSIIVLNDENEAALRHIEQCEIKVGEDEEGEKFDYFNFYRSTNWIARAEQIKKSYIGMCLAYQVKTNHKLSEDESIRLTKSYIGEFIYSDIDHQSVFEFPNRFGGKNIHWEFAIQFLNAVLDPKVLIVGGCDESDEHNLIRQFCSHPYWNVIEPVRRLYKEDSRHYSRYLPKPSVWSVGNHWTVFWKDGT